MDYQITALKVQTRNPNRVNIYLNGSYAFSLARIIAAWLKVGQTINEDKIESLKNQDSDEKALQRALNFISYKPRSEKEVHTKLESVGYSNDQIGKVLERLNKAEVLNDEKFARAWVENRCVSHPRSKRLMVMELRQKGIKEEIIQKAILQGEDDEQLAMAAARRRIHRFEKLEFAEFKKKLMGYLMRQGFNYGVASGVVKQLWTECQTKEAVNL